MGNQNFNMGPQHNDYGNEYGYDNEVDYQDEIDDDQMGYGQEMMGPSSTQIIVIEPNESPFTMSQNLNL